jgi:hypothetical protein
MINRDRMFDSNDPFNAISKAYNKFGVELPRNAEHRYAPEWFDNITNSYLALDMHGYQEDNINIEKGRKETFANPKLSIRENKRRIELRGFIPEPIKPPSSFFT